MSLSIFFWLFLNFCFLYYNRAVLWHSAIRHMHVLFSTKAASCLLLPLRLMNWQPTKMIDREHCAFTFSVPLKSLIYCVNVIGFPTDLEVRILWCSGESDIYSCVTVVTVGHFVCWISPFAQQKHYIYSQATRSKILRVFICPQIFIIIILKEKGVKQMNRLADV